MDVHRAHYRRPDAEAAAAGLTNFLTARLTEDLARIRVRDEACRNPLQRPGMAAQVEVLDDLLNTLAAGRLPERRELRILLWGHGNHIDDDPGWADLLEK